MNDSSGSKLQLPVEQLREIAWEVGQCFPNQPTGDYLVFTPVRTGLAFLHWSMLEESIRALQENDTDRLQGASQALRIFDVSLIDFDGDNAHSFHDVHVEGLTGNYYLHSDQVERTLIAEIGFRLLDGRWLPLARSQSVFMDRNFRAAHSDAGGLYVAGRFKRIFPIENIYHAPVYERMHHAWDDTEHEDVRVLSLTSQTGAEVDTGLYDYLEDLTAAVKRFGIHCEDTLTRGPPDLVHVHDTGNLEAGMATAAEHALPFILSLHHTESERAGLQGREPDGAVLERERSGAEAADLVIVPHGEMRQSLLAECDLDEERVVLLPDLFEAIHPRAFDPGEVKKRYHLNPARPLVLFSGEISHAAGADLLAAAIEYVAGNNEEVQFVFVGEGPLRGELERRLSHAGFGPRIRFTGDLWHGEFHDLLAACDFVIIPARTWQDEGLAHAALEAGKPVVATHQSRIHCVKHGENGFMIYDNPGSIIWGLQEMLARPFSTGPHGIMHVSARDDRSLDSVAAELSILYRAVLKRKSTATKGDDG